MKNMMLYSLTAVGLLSSSLALAKPVIVKDWALDDTAEASCVASTNRTIHGQNYRLELSLDKSGLYPVEVWVREVPSSGQTRAFKFTTETRPSQSFAFAPYQDAAGNEIFWQVPNDTASLIAYLKRETRALILAQVPQGAGAPLTQAVDFSLRGSSAVIDALITQCNQNKALTQSEFEKAFVGSQTVALDGLKLEEEKTARLRSIYMGAVVAHTQKLQAQKELTALNTRYAKQIAELSKVTGELDQLTQKELTSLQAQKNSIQARLESLEQQIRAAAIDIEAKEAEIVGANADYDAAWRTLAPYEAEHTRLVNAVTTARNEVNVAQGRLSDLEAQINSKLNALSRAESEVNSLRSQLSRADNELRDLRLMSDNTESAYNRFEERRERQERLREHPLLRYCESSRADVCNYAARTAESEIHREVENIRQRLSSNTNEVRSLLQQKNDQISRLSSQIRDYADYQIPNLRNQVTDLRNQRPSWESRLAQAHDEVSRRSAALATYDNSVGYTAKKAAVDTASSRVVGLRADLAKLDNNRATLIRSRQTASVDLLSTDKKIEAVLAKIQATQDRSSQLNQALIPYFEEKSRLENSIAAFERSVAVNKAAFTSILTSL